MHGIKISTTYETWGGGALEVGETDDKGYEIENEEYDFRDLVRLLRNGGYSEDSGRWYSTVDEEIDFRSGERTMRACHFADVPRKRKWFDLAWRFAFPNERCRK